MKKKENVIKRGTERVQKGRSWGTHREKRVQQGRIKAVTIMQKGKKISKKWAKGGVGRRSTSQ